MGANPYKVYIDDMEIPVTPAEISTKFKSKNDFYSLMNGEVFTAIRKPDLDSWSFGFYAFSKPHPSVDLFTSQDVIRDKLKSLKADKKVFEFIVIRTTSDMSLKNSICKFMTLEDYDIKENADWRTNIFITLELKEYKPLITVKLEQKEDGRAYEVREENKDSSINIDIMSIDGNAEKERDISNGLLTGKVEGMLK